MFPVQCMRFFFIMTNSVKHGLLFYKYLTGLSSRTLDAPPPVNFLQDSFSKDYWREFKKHSRDNHHLYSVRNL